MFGLKKLLSDRAFTIELIGFIVLQVFIDIYRVFFESTYQVFGISLPELINISYLMFLSIIFFLKHLKKPKLFIPIVVYSFIVSIYLIFHIINILKFDQSILTGSELNWFKEVYFIIRTYLIPVFVFYYLVCSNMTMSVFDKVVSLLSFIISANIVLTNIFKVSFICYASALEKNSFITRNIFEWFYNPDKESPVYMTSKGWFYMGNQIGLILFILFIFVLMQALKYGNIGRFLLLLLNGIALIMIGTKVSAIGCFIALMCGVVFAIVFGRILKQFTFNLKHIIVYLLISVILVTISSYSPMFSVQENRKNAYIVTEEQKENTEKIVQKFENTDNESIDYLKFVKEFSEYVNENPYLFGIEPEFLELLPIDENFDFWYDIVIYGNNRQIDYRTFKSQLYNEAVNKNNNEFADKLLGIGYISNFPYSERDFISQNIWFGYLGTALFTGPYILVVLLGIFMALKNIKKCFIYQNAFFAFGISTSLLLSFLAGHLFFGIFSITIFAFVVAAFYKLQREVYNN